MNKWALNLRASADNRGTTIAGMAVLLPVEDVKAAADEIDRLQAIVDRLQKTEDGVTVVPVDQV